MVRLARALGCGQPNLCVMSHTPRPARSASHRGPCEQSPLNARSLKRPVSRCHTRSRALRQRVGPVGVRLRDELPTQKALWRQRNRRPLSVVQGCPGPSRNQQGLAPNRASSPGSRQRFGSGTRRRRSPASRSRTVTRDVLQPSRRRPRAPHRQGTVHDRRRRSTGAPIVASRASTASIPSEHLRTRTVGVSLRTRVADASALSPSRSAVRCCSRVDAAGMTDPGQTSFPPPPWETELRPTNASAEDDTDGTRSEQRLPPRLTGQGQACEPRGARRTPTKSCPGVCVGSPSRARSGVLSY